MTTANPNEKVEENAQCVFSLSSDSLTTTIRNLNPLFKIPSNIHQTPFILPILITIIISDLPGLVESLKPITTAQSSAP